jgi:glyoxylase-like metal-dependent hydrolase (beta-lactamase superfamily II)/rhodanese-related sulfurtransferase
MFTDEGLGHTSYLVDLGDGTALVIDPARLPFHQQAEALRRGLTIAYTADTHTHADYLSGSPDLAVGGAELIAPAEADLHLHHRGVRGGDELALGQFGLRVIATPGHTPDHLAYLLLEDGDPVAVFTGGSLMVGSVGRTDLLGADHADELARRLYRSLHANLLTLPDEVAVYPTHGAGSFCSAPSGGERTSTIGHERATNPLLAAGSEDAFVDRLLGDLGTFPSYFFRLPERNQHGVRHYDALPELDALDPDAVDEAIAVGAVVVDVRPVADYAAAHLPSSLSIELRGVFASWLGWIVDADTPLVFVLDPDQDQEDLVRQCLTIGFDELAGYLRGGIGAWTDSGRPTKRIEIVRPDERRGTTLDIRQDNEYAAGHVPGAAHIELGSLAGAELPDGPITTMCGHHERAMTGASILERRGRADLAVLWDGFGGWRDHGLPVEGGA